VRETQPPTRGWCACTRPVAFRAAYLVTGDGPEAEDATQEAFIKAYRAIDRFRPGAAFRPWLLTIVTNEARNRRRSVGRHAKLNLQVAAEGQVLPAPVSPEAAVVAAERREELLASVGELSEGERLVISYRYFLGLFEEETATALDCARGMVKSRASRALARLRKAMAGEEDA
jgi:RNA polymerase sigma factor (sigma-70 family)